MVNQTFIVNKSMQSLWVAIKIGGATGATMFATEQILIDKSTVSIAVACTCTVFICGIVWWLSAKFQKIDDRLENIEKKIRGED